MNPCLKTRVYGIAPLEENRHWRKIATGGKSFPENH